MNQYIVPANSKKSSLILGFFTYEDLIIVGIGALITVIMLLLLDASDLISVILIILPACIAAFLVFPVPNYHNIKQLLINIYTFYSGRRKYYWKGWCVKDYVRDEKQF